MKTLMMAVLAGLLGAVLLALAPRASAGEQLLVAVVTKGSERDPTTRR